MTDPQETRRIARAAKREKQRAASVDRAAKMHDARVNHEPQETQTATTQKIHIGCSGWFYWHWRGAFYPHEIPRADWFRHYTQIFDTVELNAPFYSWPTIATVKTWIKQAELSDNFVYTVKVSELITHIKQFHDTQDLILDFGHIADLLGPRFGCFLFQLPPSFTYTPERLKSIVAQLDPTRRNVVEFRHKTWWNDTVYQAFADHNIIFCTTSAPRLPDDLIKTADDIYIRFHGVNKMYRHDYTLEELTTWSHRILNSGAKQSWIYFNNDYEAHAIKNAKQLASLMGEKAITSAAFPV